MGVSSWGHHSQPQFPLCKAGTTFLPQMAPDPTTWHTVGAQETAALEWRHLGKESDGRAGEVRSQGCCAGTLSSEHWWDTYCDTKCGRGKKLLAPIRREAAFGEHSTHKNGATPLSQFPLLQNGVINALPPGGALMNEMRKSKRRTYIELALSGLYLLHCKGVKVQRADGHPTAAQGPTIHLVSRPEHPGLPRGGHARGPQTLRPGDRFVEVWGWSVSPRRV